MTAKQFPDNKAAKAAGWFSCRHQTSDAHREAKDAYREKHGPDARRRGAQEREAVHAGRTPQQQLDFLDQRPGESRRERDRLWRQIGEGKKPKPSDERDADNTTHTVAKNIRAGLGESMQAKQEMEALGRQGKE